MPRRPTTQFDYNALAAERLRQFVQQGEGKLPIRVQTPAPVARRQRTTEVERARQGTEVGETRRQGAIDRQRRTEQPSALARRRSRAEERELARQQQAQEAYPEQLSLFAPEAEEAPSGWRPAELEEPPFQRVGIQGPPIPPRPEGPADRWSVNGWCARPSEVSVAGACRPWPGTTRDKGPCR
jgi:hypothetical protein